MTVNDQIIEAAKIIWQWLPISDPVEQSDMIFILGNSSDQLPHEAAILYKRHLAPLLVISGGRGRISKNDTEREAYRYTKSLILEDIPSNRIISEDKASNTGENITFAKKLLEDKKLEVRKAIAVTTPVLSRRHKLTLVKLWPSINWTLHTPAVPRFEQLLSSANADVFINLLVGEIDRLQSYPTRGFMDTVSIPRKVAESNDLLKNSGYVDQLVSV